MTRTRTGRPRRRGFTLIELITVVAILCILVVLVVGAVGGIRSYWCRVATYQAFEAIDGALQQYCKDWGKFPWVADVSTTNPDYGKVDGALMPPTNVPAEDKNEAVLFNALTAQRGKGPYMTGQVEALTRRSGTGASMIEYTIFADGWGHKIKYTLPGAKSSTPVQAPILISLGANEMDATDDFKNYVP
jgi:prepilin-type N-terminal cleavage/methylation domain-containing protein